MIPPDPLRQLHDLDRTSPQFHKQLRNFLCGDEYRDVVTGLQGEDLVWLVEYLDNVSPQTILSPLCAQHRIRFSSNFPIPQVPDSRSPCMNSEIYAALRRCCRNLVCFQNLFRTLPFRPLLDTCVRGPPAVQGCELNA